MHVKHLAAAPAGVQNQAAQQNAPLSLTPNTLQIVAWDPVVAGQSIQNSSAGDTETKDMWLVCDALLPNMHGIYMQARIHKLWISCCRPWPWLGGLLRTVQVPADGGAGSKAAPIVIDDDHPEPSRPQRPGSSNRVRSTLLKLHWSIRS